MILKSLNIDKSWTLFLDRDGVINKKLENDYVKHWIEFEFIEGVTDILLWSPTNKGLEKGFTEPKTWKLFTKTCCTK